MHTLTANDGGLSVNRITRHIQTQRRRLVTSGLLAFVAGFALYAHVHATAFGLPFPVFTGLFYAIAVVLAAAVSSFVFPRLRRLIDGTALSRLGFAGWVVLGQHHDIAASPLLSATIVVGGAILLIEASSRLETLGRSAALPAPLDFAIGAGRAWCDWLDNTGQVSAIPRSARAAPLHPAEV